MSIAWLDRDRPAARAVGLRDRVIDGCDVPEDEAVRRTRIDARGAPRAGPRARRQRLDPGPRG